MLNRIFSIVYSVIGIASVILGILVYEQRTGTYLGFYNSYSGSDTEEMFRLLSETGNNVYHLSEILQYGFCCLFILLGSLLFAYGLKGFIGSFLGKNKNNAAPMQVQGMYMPGAPAPYANTQNCQNVPSQPYQPPYPYK